MDIILQPTFFSMLTAFACLDIEWNAENGCIKSLKKSSIRMVKVFCSEVVIVV